MDETLREPMPREIDDRKKRKVLNRIRRAMAAAERAIEASEDEAAAEEARQMLSDWESEFVASVEQRLNEYGSAFADPDKGNLDEPLSRLQELKLKEIEKKAKGKAPRSGSGGFNRGSSFKSKGSGFKRKQAGRRSNTRDIHEDVEDDRPPEPRPAGPALMRASELKSSPEDDRPAAPRPAFKVIEGGKS